MIMFIMNIKPHPFTLPFVKKEQIATDTFAFYFDRSKENWEFYPGQYIRMMIPNEAADDRGTMRYFTISSSPTDRTHLRIVTKVIKSTFKKDLFSKKEGDEVSFFGPNGDFYFREEEKDHVFLAGGIGITPFLSMIEYAADKNVENNITLFASFSTLEEMVYYDKLSQIGEKHRNIKIVYTLTKEEGDAWKGEKGRISIDLIKKYVPDVKTPVYYIVGPPPMVEASVSMIESIEIADDHILQEHFSGY